MIVTCWILLVVFSILDLVFIRKLFFDSINIFEAILMLFGIFVSALTAGIIFGSLKLFN